MNDCDKIYLKLLAEITKNKKKEWSNAKLNRNF